ncbi:MAG TPA: transglycosylase domain-containing protein, partial [Verrucomicrobiales bacterium]|nr:transglycosylase domain-containing protein [Verrucomicrobiales bacterium]
EKAETYDLAQVPLLEQSSIVYDRNHAEIGRLANENRVIIPYSEMPKHLIDALIATEDQRFWKHHGVDYWGILRAAKDNFLGGETMQGASTITQQLARNTFGLTERSKERKILEIYIALRIEKVYAKSEILQHYLNRIPLGKGFYGIEAAAQGYFSKSAKDLTKNESATLIGLIKAPRDYNPINNMTLSTRERNKVFDRMVAEKMLDESESAKLKKEAIPLHPSEAVRATGYVQKEVEDEVESILAGMGIEGITGKGYKIYTTIDSTLQQAAEQSLSKRLAEIEQSEGYPNREKMSDYTKKFDEFTKSKRPANERPVPGYLQGTVLAVDNKTGGVLALCGGRDFGQSQYNRVMLTRRPSGTVFVPFVYTAAFEGNHFPGSRVADERMDNTKVMMGATTGTLGEWGNEGLAESHEGSTSLRRALIQGKNNCAARLGLDIGVKKVTDLAARAGLGEMAQDPSTFLGRGEVTLHDLCLAYTIFPNGGTRPENTWFVTRIEKPDGTRIYERSTKSKTVEVTDPISTWMTHSCLEESLLLDIGTASIAKKFGLKDIPVAGKTGTHINSTDLWFAGYSNDVTCAVWVGLDRKEPVYPDAFSRHTALPIWVDIMNASASKKVPEPIAQPDGVQLVELCAVSGQLATDSCLELGPDPLNPGRQKFIKCSYQEYIRPESKLEMRCTFHTGED